MNFTSTCIICENRYISRHFNGLIQPWNCPHCNNDTEEKIQRDLNELFKLIGFEATSRLVDRANKLVMLSQMYKKLDEQPVSVCLG